MFELTPFGVKRVLREYTIVRWTNPGGTRCSAIYDQDEHEALNELKYLLQDIDYEEEILRPN